jgi:glucose/arabinose dehydrogenase
MARDPKNALLVSETKEGKVVALPDLDGDGKADSAIIVLEGLNDPHGLLVLCGETGFESADQDDCTLYVAESHRAAAFRYDADTYTARYEKTLFPLPDDGGHNTRTLMLHPDNTRILVSVGSSCNVCLEEDGRRAAILAFDPAKEGYTKFATGLRNTVFMTTHYVTGEIWGTDMGRDMLGDDLPPDEINIIREGDDYGWPYCYGKNIRDKTVHSEVGDPCRSMTTSHLDIPAHSAPLGLAFVPEEGWPEEWWYDALVAYHGSWNRSVPTGYKLVRFPLDAQGDPEGPPVDFMTGFMGENGSVTGRPVDILIEPGGTLYVSDDRAGAIYRIVRTTAP